MLFEEAALTKLFPSAEILPPLCEFQLAVLDALADGPVTVAYSHMWRWRRHYLPSLEALFQRLPPSLSSNPRERIPAVAALVRQNLVRYQREDLEHLAAAPAWVFAALQQATHPADLAPDRPQPYGGWFLLTPEGVAVLLSRRRCGTIPIERARVAVRYVRSILPQEEALALIRDIMRPQPLGRLEDKPFPYEEA